ncbi:hypothetical protein [Martelella mangrovi]|uniref:RNase P protein component n=1 Tax=Martelella mangrovi TaxID=1397477 RepID=A0ABV2I713_9HYPH
MIESNPQLCRKAINDSVSKIQKSRYFANSPILKKFLKYIVDEVLDGRADRIKSYSIGIEVFNRPSDFDAAGDAIVRNTARRLRAALAAYYDNEGSDDTVVIAVPKGCYVPEFSVCDEPSVAPAVALESESPADVSPADSITAFAVRRNWRQTGYYLALAVLLLGTAFGASAFVMAHQGPETATNIIMIVEKTDIRDDRYKRLAAAVDARLAPALARNDIVTLVTSDIAAPRGPATVTLQGMIVPGDDAPPKLMWRLYDHLTGALIAASGYNFPSSTPTGRQIDSATRTLAFQILGENGVLTRQLSGIAGAQKTRSSCLLRSRTLYWIYDEDPGYQLIAVP